MTSSDPIYIILYVLYCIIKVGLKVVVTLSAFIKLHKILLNFFEKKLVSWCHTTTTNKKPNEFKSKHLMSRCLITTNLRLKFVVVVVFFFFPLDKHASYTILLIFTTFHFQLNFSFLPFYYIVYDMIFL